MFHPNQEEDDEESKYRPKQRFFSPIHFPEFAAFMKTNSDFLRRVLKKQHIRLSAKVPQKSPASASIQTKTWTLRVGSSLLKSLRKSLLRSSVPSVSCEAASNWPRSWHAPAGPSRASSAQNHSWQ